VKMSQIVEKMNSHSTDILNIWMEKLFPSKNQGCINFGYWKNIKKPLTTKKRIDSQRKLYFEMFNRFNSSCKTVLEVGSGRGHGVFWLREKGYEAYGIDVLPSQIEKSKEVYSHLTSYFKIGEAERIPFQDHSFDCVCSLEAAQHFVSFEAFCKESFRILKCNGKLVVSTYFLNDKSFVKDLQRIIPDNLEGFHNALVISDAIAFMQAAGFEIHIPSFSIGNEVFPLYSYWQKKQLGNTPPSALSKERIKWKGYYTGGGNEFHPWYQAFKNGWIDYYFIEGFKAIDYRK
jgi:SAM-dependent methyltransferase